MIHEDLNRELKEAMKAREAVRLSVIRDLKSAFTNELVSLGKKPDDLLDDENALKVVRRKINQRKDSIEQYKKAGRDELVAKERSELEVLEGYLPTQLNDEEIQELVEKKKKELEISEAKDMGRLIGAVMKEVGSRADGKRVQEIVKNSIS
ncbi:MAG: GatB/YqeY domain-containing protein [Candidatus Campbellbacteria bacterium]|nr:GatB/YqeY domain-containing protein [Candidatus Campbellbacteria bacterium]